LTEANRLAPSSLMTAAPIPARSQTTRLLRRVGRVTRARTTPPSRSRQALAITRSTIRKPTPPPTPRATRRSILPITCFLHPRSKTTTAHLPRPMELTRAVVKVTEANRLAPSSLMLATAIRPTQPMKTPRCSRLQRITAITRAPIRKPTSPPSLRTTRWSTLPITRLICSRTTTAHLLRPMKLTRAAVIRKSTTSLTTTRCSLLPTTRFLRPRSMTTTAHLP